MDASTKKQAEDHAKWEAQFILNVIKEVVYVVARDNFLHGYKHCLEDNKDRFDLLKDIIEDTNKDGEYP
jgi:hypothetical protein